jgi:hypothetical protein
MTTTDVSDLSPEKILELTVRALVDKPEEVRIHAHVTPRMATFEIHVADSDVGKVLGRKGAYARALRTLYGAIYGKLDKTLALQVIDPRRR